MNEANQDLKLDHGPLIPASELSWTFGPSGGPGGQHANRAHSRAEIRFSIVESVAFSDEQVERISSRLANRLRNGSVAVTADDHRSQWRNRQVARARLKTLLDDALQPDPPTRRPTRPSRRAETA